MSSVFLSYSTKDQEAARFIASHLAASGADVFIDFAKLRAGKDFTEQLRQQIETCDYFVLVLSPNSAKSKWVKAEVDYAHEKGKVIVPLVLEDGNFEVFWYINRVERVHENDWWKNKKFEFVLGKLNSALGLVSLPPESGENGCPLYSTKGSRGHETETKLRCSV